MIEEGMVITNHQGIKAPLTRVEKGRHGLLIADSDTPPLTGFVPWELPPVEERGTWYGWQGGRAFITLPSGMKLGIGGRCINYVNHKEMCHL